MSHPFDVTIKEFNDKRCTFRIACNDGDKCPLFNKLHQHSDDRCPLGHKVPFIVMNRESVGYPMIIDLEDMYDFTNVPIA